MDESWRMRMGMPTAPPPPTTTRHMPEYAARRSTEDAAIHRRKPISDDPLNPEDFNDVFGGPPRTILSRQFSTGGFSRSSSSTNFSYEEIFRPSDKAAPATRRSGRSLPEFKIPGQTRRSDHNNNQNKRQNNGFFSDIFGWEDDQRVVRSRSRSKTSSSSVLSSEELSPLRPPFDYDVSFLASKLRPINVRSEWSSTRTGMGYEEHQRQQHVTTPPFAGRRPFYSNENNGPDNLRSYPFGLSRRNASPETISMDPISNGSFIFSADDLELIKSPSSPVSSVCQSSGKEQKSCCLMDDEDGDDDDDDDDIMSSYVIEINSDNREGVYESNGVDEAIAWAREKFQPQYSTEDLKMLDGHHVSEGLAESFNSSDEKQDKLAAKEETQQYECTLETELQILDEQIRLWSSGKESDIRLLLSSLHHILWPESGWLAVPLSYIIEISQVKKAYQKARLCLHPDKLQQRGATVPQKYVADKAFYVLQDAWSAFISQDVF